MHKKRVGVLLLACVAGIGFGMLFGSWVFYTKVWWIYALQTFLGVSCYLVMSLYFGLKLEASISDSALILIIVCCLGALIVQPISEAEESLWTGIAFVIASGALFSVFGYRKYLGALR